MSSGVPTLVSKLNVDICVPIWRARAFDVRSAIAGLGVTALSQLMH
jgi:hypothetical protein